MQRLPEESPGIGDGDRQSHDDLEHVADLDRLERERVLLAAQLQDSQEEKARLVADNARLRQLATPTTAFPPTPSVPPPSATKSSAPPMGAAAALPKRFRHWAETALAIGVSGAIAWNAFLSYKTIPKADKVDAVAARQTASEAAAAQKALGEAAARQERELLLEVLDCWGRQLRASSARSGLDLPSLPAGGVEVLKLAEDEPNRPRGAPMFVAKEHCKKLPKVGPTPAP